MPGVSRETKCPCYLAFFISDLAFFLSRISHYYLACRIFISHVAFLSRMSYFLSRMSYFFSVVPAAESFVSPAAESSASPTAESPASPAAVPVLIPAADIDASLEVLTEENFGFMANFLKSSHEMIRLARYVDDRLSESNLRTSFPGPAASNGLPLSPDVVPQKFPGRPHRVVSLRSPVLLRVVSPQSSVLL